MRLLALLLLAAAAAAGDAKEVAWFAYRAGEQGDKTAVPRLVEALEREPGARRWVLDALIRLEGKVPAEGVAPLFEQWPDETLILLARDPKQNEAHLAAIAEASDAGERYLHWVAACNLLAAQKSKRLAAPLLRDLELTLDIWVTDAAGLGGGSGEGRWSGRRVHYGRADPQLPPMPFYVLSRRQEGGAVVVATGRDTVFFVRSVTQQGERGGDFTREVRPTRGRNRRRVAYLAELLGVEPWKLGFLADDVKTVAWRGVEAYPDDVAATRDRAAKGYEDMVGKLVAEKLLDPQAAPKAPQLKVRVADRRTDKSVALPALEGVETKPE